MQDFPLFPEQASTVAGQVDAIYLTLVGLSIIFGLGVAIAIIILAIRYREGNDVDRSNAPHESLNVELAWSVLPLMLALGIFGWGTFVYFDIKTPPEDAIEIYVIGKQWMWHAQHPAGKSEINELHVPTDQPVKLIMTSQDVIHNFYIPAFRVKQDVVPGRYTTLWFEATQEGEYHLFCAEYCGTEHSKMVGTVIAMQPTEYETWLQTSSNGGGTTAGLSLAQAGEQLFQAQGCASCHAGGDSQLGPSLVGIMGDTHQFADGGTAVVDEAYLRESILAPMERVVQGYNPVMPTYEGQLTEQQIIQMVAYIKSLSEDDAAAN